MSSRPPADSTYATPSPSKEVIKQDDVHRHRRRFIGPMPAAALQVDLKRPQKHKHERALLGRQHESDESECSDDDSSSLSDVIRRHALQFFLKHGGQRDDWGESQQNSVRKEMMRRWQQSDWARARKRQKQAGTAQKWVGTSFDIGIFLGVDIMDEHLAPSQQVSTVRPTIDTYPSSAGAATFVTAQSHPEPPVVLVNGLPSSIASREQITLKQPSPDSSTVLLPATSCQSGELSARPTTEPEVSNRSLAPPAESQRHESSSAPSLSKLSGKAKGKRKGKEKANHVHYETPAAPPAEVLARTGSAVNVTSAGAVEQTTSEAKVHWGDIIMRDRMLVKISYTEDGVPSTFDEWQNRTTRHLENEGWAEYIVAWRKDRLELYRDHRPLAKQWFTGTKRLKYVVPLGSPSTHLSLYSFVDLTFCVTCPYTPLKANSKRARYFGSYRGTNILVFKLKSRTRAIDWMWQLWRHLGGQLPPYIEVRTPALDTRIKIDVPGFDTADLDAAYSVFHRSNIIRLCRKYLHTVPEYRALVEREAAAGAEFELAWRLYSDLDWVWQETDVRGTARKWAVLCGIALKQADRPAHLEFRRKQHLPTRLHMKDGTRLDEPLAVEGYLDRIRPNSQLRQSLYLVTHDGYLFSLSPAHAHPPHPPGAPLTPSDSHNALHASDLVPGAVDTRRKADVRRGRLQILEATGMFDLRSVVVVRRAFQLIPQGKEENATTARVDWEDTEGFWEQAERSESDDEDAGGEVGMGRTKDKTRLRMRRSFELVLTSGRVVRFEAYSCATALEWIVRLRQLVSYWKKRHQIDALLEMKIAHASTGHERITPQRPRDGHRHAGEHDTPPEPVPDREAALPDLALLYNWCVLDGCRAILKCGRLYGRKGWWGQYSHVQLILLSGHLVQYHVSGTGMMHYRKPNVISLLDAYVCSGYLAAQYLPDGQYDANARPVARRYQDGLETDDREEDTLFVVWYRIVRGAAPGVGRNNAGADVPPLKAKRKVVVFRTRSRLERDAWVWAINVEVEKVVRASKEREEAVRQAGQLRST